MPFGWFKRKNAAEAQPAIGASAAVSEITREVIPTADVNPEMDVVVPTEPATAPATMMIPHDKIAARAFEAWDRKGRPVDCDLQNWLEAEAELRAEYLHETPPEAPIRKPR